jgi:L-lactate dehydrogenase complex protein LldG
MIRTDASAAFDNDFLRTIRTAVSPGSDQVRSKADFPGPFHGQSTEQLVARIGDREVLDHTGLAAAFIENAKPLNLHTALAGSIGQAAEIIATLARECKPEFGTGKHIIQHAHPDLLTMQLWKLLAEDPIAVHTTFSGDPDLREKTVASFIGITVADWGIADSATLVQCTAPGLPRSTSLVPSIHVGLLFRDRILANLDEAYALLREKVLADSVTFISGPSKTADIEAHMVHGAHGPREMHVIIIDPPESS